MKTVLVVAPHPDDETLGCGGTLLKHIAAGDRVVWLIVSAIDEENGFSAEQVAKRDAEINQVSRAYPFSQTFRLGFPTMRLDEIPMRELVQAVALVFQEVKPEIVYVPNRSDAHSDHQYVFDATVACTKWFRYPFVKKVLVYETLSETEFGLAPESPAFRPNVFIDISPYMERKWEIMSLFAGEVGAFPFPRSEVSIRALAQYRGSSSGCSFAESFMLLREVVE